MKKVSELSKTPENDYESKIFLSKMFCFRGTTKLFLNETAFHLHTSINCTQVAWAEEFHSIFTKNEIFSSLNKKKNASGQYLKLITQFFRFDFSKI